VVLVAPTKFASNNFVPHQVEMPVQGVFLPVSSEPEKNTTLFSVGQFSHYFTNFDWTLNSIAKMVSYRLFMVLENACAAAGVLKALTNFVTPVCGLNFTISYWTFMRPPLRNGKPEPLNHFQMTLRNLALKQHIPQVSCRSQTQNPD
jgi:hypothetical protein